MLGFVAISSSCGSGSGSSSGSIISPPSDSFVEPPAGGSAPTPAEIAAQFGLDPTQPPSSNFELIDWYLNTPEENTSGLSTRIDENSLAAGFVDPDYFFTGEDGSMVFRVTNSGAKTSSNTSYTRTELREMLRSGDTSINTRNSDGTPNLNNWVFSSAPASAQNSAGGVDGTLRATLAVNAVTESGSNSRRGRVIVGQIHAKDDEPIRLYYRKLPDNERGSIYAAHEISGGDDTYYEIVGSRDNDAANPTAGPALNEIWSYEIIAEGNMLTAIVRNGDLDGVELGRANIDMSDSGYNVADDFMYFKAGAYNQNNTEDGGEPDDFAQVSFYVLENTHN